jgi:hypothetical protein
LASTRFSAVPNKKGGTHAHNQTGSSRSTVRRQGSRKVTDAIEVSKALVDLIAALNKLEATISLPPTFTEAVRAAGLLPCRDFRLASNAQTGDVLRDTQTRVLHYLVSPEQSRGGVDASLLMEKTMSAMAQRMLTSVVV